MNCVTLAYGWVEFESATRPRSVPTPENNASAFSSRASLRDTRRECKSDGGAGIVAGARGLGESGSESIPTVLSLACAGGILR